MAGESVVIAVPTRDRIDQLAVLLPLLVQQLVDNEQRGQVLVVDNSDTGSARPAVDAIGAGADASRVRYVHEPVRGLAAVRNRALDEASEADWIAWIDDDELPSDGWLRELLRVQSEHDADVVGGPVIMELPADAPGYLAASGLFTRLRPRSATGLYGKPVHTGNALIRVARLRDSGVRFDAGFNRTGGEDTEFFWTLLDQGARICWADEAVLTETVPADRLGVRALLWRQSVRAANYVRIERRHRSLTGVLIRQASRALARTGAGMLGLLVGAVLLDRGRMLRGAYDLAYGLGTAAGMLGLRPVLY